MTKREVIALIDKKCAELGNPIESPIGDGCEIEGEPIWVHWPMKNGETLGVYSDEIMAEDKPATVEEISALLPGWQVIQNYIFCLTDDVT